MASSSSPAEPWYFPQTEPWNLSQENRSRKLKTHKNTEPWDIFINYCLRNVNRTFASAIYHRLSSMGFHVFFDVKVLRLGDCFSAEIQHAMATAKLHIAIFSPSYAHFAWCLTELSFMLKSGAKIIPIFYHIEPYDLRNIAHGKYAGAFLEYEKKRRYSTKMLNEWKMALRSISFLDGYNVNGIKDEAAVLNNIVNHAFKIGTTFPLFICEHPVGLDELAQDFQSVASEEKGKIIGIVGMGGSGKTTLAKELFNRNFSSFEFCSFVSDLRDASLRNALPDMQKKLLANLGVHHSPFDTIDEGKSVLATYLRFHRALVVLDGVDHIDQLNALLPNKDMLGSDSMVIVTSRDLSILKSWGLFYVYKMPRFHSFHAEEIFCWQAFMRPSPQAEFETLVQNFVQVCDGLPLSLTVLGTQLYGRKSIEHWENQLLEISRILPGEIQQRLQVSYDSLDQEQKETFLDVACFLIGERKNTAIEVWDGSGWSGLHNLDILENKCLVELVDDPDFSEEKIIRMHNHLAVLGRDIASRNELYRVWCPNQIVNMEELPEKRNVIRGINAVPTGIWECELYGEDMANLREGLLYLASSLVGLKLLVIRGDFLNQIVAQVSRELLWLRWFQIGRKNIPAWLSLKHLRILELYEDSEGEHHLEELWEETRDPPLQLRELIISDCHAFQRFPNSIGRLKHLKRIVITRGNNFRSLPEEFCHLHSLQHLQLFDCVMLLSLPRNFGELGSLRYLDLSNCKNLKSLPDSLGHLSSLTDLSIQSCHNLEYCPSSLGDLSSLTNLKILNCPKFFPDCFERLLNLEKLNLSGFPRRILPPLLPIRNLRVLELHGANKMEGLWEDEDHAPLQLRELIITGTWSASFRGFPSSISYLKDLKKIALLGDAVKEFGIKGLPEEFCDLQSLEHLELRYCTFLSSLPARFGDLRNLRYLVACSSKALRMLPVSFKKLKSLKHLDLSGCKRLVLQKEILENIRGLENLNLSGCLALQKIPDQVSNQACLRGLQLDHTSLQNLPVKIGQLSKLEVLTIGSPLLKNLPDSLGNLSYLKSLSIVNCYALECLPETLGNLVLLEHLCIEATGVRSLPEGIRQLANLRTLRISDCPLKELDFGSMYSSSLVKLTEMNLSETLVTRISISDECCPRLETLRLSKNDNLEVIETFPTTVKNIELSECETLKNIKDTFALPTSLNFTISDCPGLEKASEFRVLDSEKLSGPGLV